jgi:hypothetical protein
VAQNAEHARSEGRPGKKHNGSDREKADEHDGDGLHIEHGKNTEDDGADPGHDLTAGGHAERFIDDPTSAFSKSVP